MAHLADALNPQVLAQQLTAVRERNKFLEEMCARMNSVMLLLVPPNSPRHQAVFEGYQGGEMPPAEVMAERIEAAIRGDCLPVSPHQAVLREELQRQFLGLSSAAMALAESAVKAAKLAAQ